MFGPKLDYRLLKPLTHRKGYATRADLEQQAVSSTFSITDASAYLERVRDTLFCGAFKVDRQKSYLDVGCGMGRLALGLASAGVSDVTGIEIIDRNVTEANRLASLYLPEDRRPRFIHTDIHDWDTDRQFDFIIALGALEHIHDQPGFLSALPRYLKPGGRCFVSIEPFHSPFGDHMMHFFRFPIPWMGLLFNEKAVLRLRAERFRPDDPVERYENVEGGLNKVRYGRYLQNVERAGLEFVAHYINPQLRERRSMKPLRWLSDTVTAIPGLRDYFVIADYGILRRKPD